MAATSQPELGDKVRDRVTGFTGIVVAETRWLNGCLRMSIQPEMDKDGKIPPNEGFDVEQLEVITKCAVAPKAPERRAPIGTNGPMPEPRRV